MLFVHLVGGMDELYSVNPRAREELADGIRPFFGAAELLTRGSLRLAPAWSPLAPYADRMQVILGVQSNSVAHEAARLQVHQLRRNITSMKDASFATRIGALLRPDDAIHAIDFDPQPGTAVEGRSFADPKGALLGALHAAANDDRAYEATRTALAAALRAPARGHGDGGLRLVDRLIAKMRGTAKPVAPPKSAFIDEAEWPRWLSDPRQRWDGLEFAWARYVFEHDLAPTMVLMPTPIWDTHGNNHQLQAPLNHQLASWLRHLLDALAEPRVGGPPLLDDTGVVVLSELGRFPYPNSYGGKDHFPQIAVTLIGPGLTPGRFGDTGRELLGTPVSLTTGRSGPGATHLTLDDIGRTLLEWVGHPDPGGLGYDGRVLDFCLT